MNLFVDLYLNTITILKYACFNDRHQMLFAKVFDIFPIFRPFLNKINLHHTYIYKMDKAYMRCPEGSEVFELSFQYFNTELKVNRKFNFSRQLSEPVNSLLSRICTNVDKVINKKQKRQKDPALNVEKDTLNQVYLFQNGTEVSGEMLCEDLFKHGGDIRLKILNNEYTVMINTPWVKNISLPSSMLANFPVYPTKFETLFVDKLESEFTWFKSNNKNNWALAGSGFLYTPSKNDINFYLKLICLPKNNKDIGPHIEIVSSGKVEADPGQSPFDIRHNFTKDKLLDKNFRVVTYNLLADIYCDSDYSRTVLFPYCPAYALHIDYRKQLFLKELIGYNADIICLQEVDEKVFENDLSPVLSTFDLDGHFRKKGGTQREGLACFYNSKRFKLLHTTSLVLAKFNTNPICTELWNKISKNENLVKRITDLGTTLQLTILESIENNQIFLVANTHLYFHPNADHIRLLQAGITSILIEDTIKKLNNDKRVSVIYCGDFNSVPECGIFKLYTTGVVDDKCIDWNSKPEEEVKDVILTHNRIFGSACGTPKYTNFTVGFQDCLDYIFYEKNNFEVTQVIPPLSYEELTAHLAIPSVLMPSDHVAQIADLKLL